MSDSDESEHEHEHDKTCPCSDYQFSATVGPLYQDICLMEDRKRAYLSVLLDIIDTLEKKKVVIAGFNEAKDIKLLSEEMKKSTEEQLQCMQTLCDYAVSMSANIKREEDEKKQPKKKIVKYKGTKYSISKLK
jgi:hypothetical protein